MDLQECRKRIDKLDDELVSLFCQRMNIVGQVAEIKATKGANVQDPGREREILTRISKAAGPELENSARVVFHTLFEVSRAHQTQRSFVPGMLSQNIEKALAKAPILFPETGVVACQGTEGAYAQMACDKLFSHAEIMYFRHFEGVFQAVDKGLCQYGVLPVENSAYGSVNEVYDLMGKYHFSILRSLRLHVNHRLLVKPGVDFSKVKEVFSHEQAVGQCSSFLTENRQIQVTLCENTAIAAKMVAESSRDDIAAISSGDCAALYGLQALPQKVQNSDNNYTRFICIGRDMCIYPGANRISLMLSVPHSPGALYNTIAKFAALGVNLTKLESRPVPGSDFAFLFYFDFDGSVRDPKVAALLEELSSTLDVFVFLGNYQEV